MENETTEKILDFIMKYNIISKAVVTLFLIFTAVIVRKFVSLIFSKWHDKIIKNLQKKDPASVSSAETKLRIINRSLNIGIYFLAFIFILFQFETVRSLGAGLLASAGVAGIIFGMAAQNSVSNIIAGVSISFSQPVRLGDAVIFENDFGWIEEISLMHTVIKTWDNRRIMVPNDVLIKKVIQNWTIKDPSLLGIVMLYVDYTCDIDQLKHWVKEIVDESQNTAEEKVAVVQVVDFTEKTMVVRILSKGPDAPKTWALRCEIREKLIKRFRENSMPLPVIRLDSREKKSEAENQRY